MKLHSSMTVNDVRYEKGDEISAWKIYPFFLIHMLMFGGSGFMMAYFSGDDVPLFFMFVHGGIAILAYVAFYFAIFGKDEVKWMFINAGLGLFGIYVEIDWLLALGGKQLSDYSLLTHVVPFLYYILYTFLIRQMFIDIFKARENEDRLSIVNNLYN